MAFNIELEMVEFSHSLFDLIFTHSLVGSDIQAEPIQNIYEYGKNCVSQHVLRYIFKSICLTWVKASRKNLFIFGLKLRISLLVCIETELKFNCRLWKIDEYLSSDGNFALVHSTMCALCCELGIQVELSLGHNYFAIQHWCNTSLVFFFPVMLNSTEME